MIHTMSKEREYCLFLVILKVIFSLPSPAVDYYTHCDEKAVAAAKLGHIEFHYVVEFITKSTRFTRLV